MSKLPTSERRTSKFGWFTTRNISSYLEVGHEYGFRSRFASDSMQYDSILLIVDRLTNSAHFIFFKSIYSVKDYARIFIDEIVCHHGILLSNIGEHNSHLGFGGHSDKGWVLR